MTKYEIRLYGHGGWGKCEVSFDQEPTVKMVQDKVAFCLEEGSLLLHKERFYANTKGTTPHRFTTTYEKLNDNLKPKKIQDVLGIKV